ncbi:MAG: DUF4292 domain-containing protein [Bacteroidia bacterium]|nr:DUF4292 domain-containing protein [Bacteroidia bacterium]
MNKLSTVIYFSFFLALLTLFSCKSKQKTQQTQPVISNTEDTLGKCRLIFKTAKSLSRHIKDNELKYDWISSKADVEVRIDDEDHNLDVRVKAKKDSIIWISIQAVGMIDVAKLLITKDSVKMVVYIKKKYFIGDFNYINQLLNAELDFDLIQAALIGNSADFDEDDTKMKPIIDRELCHYILSTERKRKLRRISNKQDSLKRSLQIMRLNPINYKIVNNEFQDIATNRSFRAEYSNFVAPDSVFAPHLVNIEIKAEKKINLKINYVRIEVNKPQKTNLNIPKSYEPITTKKETH